jgi:hypothetical protein
MFSVFFESLSTLLLPSFLTLLPSLSLFPSLWSLLLSFSVFIFPPVHLSLSFTFSSNAIIMYLCFSFDPLFHSLPSSSLHIFLIHSQSRKYIYEIPSLIHCFPYLLFFTPLHYLSPSHSSPSPLSPSLCPFLFPHSFFSHLSHTHIHLLLLFSFFFSTVLFFTFRFFFSLSLSFFS